MQMLKSPVSLADATTHVLAIFDEVRRRCKRLLAKRCELKHKKEKLKRLRAEGEQSLNELATRVRHCSFAIGKEWEVKKLKVLLIVHLYVILSERDPLDMFSHDATASCLHTDTNFYILIHQNTIRFFQNPNNT